MVTLNDYLALSAILFAIGAAGVFVRRNLITILLSIEIMLNAVNLTFVAFGRALGSADGQIIVFFVMAVAAAEAAGRLAVIIALFPPKESLNPHSFTVLKWWPLPGTRRHEDSKKTNLLRVVVRVIVPSCSPLELSDAAADSAAAVPRLPGERQLRPASQQGGRGRRRLRGDDRVVPRVGGRRMAVGGA